MEKTILYPFSITEDNKVSYQKTMELASKIAAKVICFTVVKEEDKLDDAYLHLLGLNGYYQSMGNSWENPQVKIEKAIGIGDLSKALGNYLTEKEIDVLIHQSPVNHVETKVLTAWMDIDKNRIEVFNA